MTKDLHVLILTVVLALACGTVARTQDPSTNQPSKATAAASVDRPLVPLKIQIVISRYQGNKKISSLPYALSVTANDGRFERGQYLPNTVERLRIGAQVPVPMMPTPVIDGQKMPTGGPVQYKDVGTNIDCYAAVTEDGRFKSYLTIEDTSVYPEGQTTQGAPRLNDVPTFRSFRSSNVVVLKDGQSTEFAAATDKISGEVVKVDVTLTVVK